MQEEFQPARIERTAERKRKATQFLGLGMGFVCLALAIVCSLSPMAIAEETPTYDNAIKSARALMDQGKLAEAYLAASAAISQDEKRWEAYALVALVLGAQGSAEKAVGYVDKALARAPEAKKPTLTKMRGELTKQAASEKSG